MFYPLNVLINKKTLFENINASRTIVKENSSVDIQVLWRALTSIDDLSSNSGVYHGVDVDVYFENSISNLWCKIIIQIKSDLGYGINQSIKVVNNLIGKIKVEIHWIQGILNWEHLNNW